MNNHSYYERRVMKKILLIILLILVCLAALGGAIYSFVVRDLPTINKPSVTLNSDLPGVKLQILDTDAFLQPFIQSGYISDSKVKLIVHVTGTQQANPNQEIAQYEPSKTTIYYSYATLPTTDKDTKTLIVSISPDFTGGKTVSDNQRATLTLWQAILQSIWLSTHTEPKPPTLDAGMKAYLQKYVPNTVISVTSKPT